MGEGFLHLVVLYDCFEVIAWGDFEGEDHALLVVLDSVGEADLLEGGFEDSFR